MGCKTGELLGPFGVTPHLAPPPPTTLPSRTWTAATWFPSRESANCQPRVLMESTDESSSSRQTFVCALQRPKDREERYGEANRLFRKRTPGLHSVGHSRQDGIRAFSVDALQNDRPWAILRRNFCKKQPHEYKVRLTLPMEFALSKMTWLAIHRARVIEFMTESDRKMSKSVPSDRF